MVNGVVHDFQERLEYSAKLSDEPAWIAFYKRIWPDMLMAIRIDKDCKQQRLGIDRKILLPNGKEFTIDEKKREKDYGDLLVEEWSVADYDPEARIVTKGRKVGWSMDDSKHCDFIAYSVPESGKCYLLPFELTRLTCKHNIERWKRIPKAYPKASRNNGYWTINVAVSWSDFKIALFKQMHRKFGNVAALPLPKKDNPQLTFFEHGPTP